jgi:Pyridoxamine 5'-phosphate oxidase
VGPDGRPQLSEVWFLAEGDTIGISLNTSRQKTRNLRANPAVNLSRPGPCGVPADHVLTFDMSIW